VIEHVLRSLYKNATWADRLPGQLVLGLITYVAVCIAWVFFRAADFPTALRILGAMAGKIPVGEALFSNREILQVALVTAGLLAIHWTLRQTTLESAVSRMPRWLLTVVWAGMAFLLILNQGNGSAFIYFQF
jgi:alginate O-acetyltransferase complex protein AlgI